MEALLESSQAVMGSHIPSVSEGTAQTRKSEDPTKKWSCFCCSRLNDSQTKECRTCGRPAVYVPAIHDPFFGTMGKFMRPEQAVFLLDERGLDVNATDMENWTPAHVTCTYGNSGLLRVLLDRGALIEAQTKLGWRPLHCAAQGGHTACVDLLLGRSSSVSCTTKGHLSKPLHVAAAAGSEEICSRLLEKGADPDARDVMERTPLHVAADRGHLEVVRVLLDGGAAPDVHDHDMWTPRQVAEFRGLMKVASLLAEASSPSCAHVGKHGATITLPSAPWHSELFAQVREDTASANRREARSSDREAVYEALTDVFREKAAERYADCLEESRRSRGGREAYRKRVFASSADAQRYWGYNSDASDDDVSEGVTQKDRSQMTGLKQSRSCFDTPMSTGAAETSSTKKATAGGIEEGTHRRTSLLPSGGQGGYSREAGVVEEEQTRPIDASGISGRAGESRGGVPSSCVPSGSSDGFVDVVPFNNIRAKYLRAWHDIALSRPYHVPCAVDPVALPSRR